MKNPAMPRIFNLRSINLDTVIQLVHFPASGETIFGNLVLETLGGKGLNASVAMHHAASSVRHICAVNRFDSKTLSAVASLGLDIEFIEQIDAPTGRATVMLNASGENRIVVCPGANKSISNAHISAALRGACVCDWLVMQNETNGQAQAIQIAKDLGLKVGWN